jgi:heat shock protein HslJ
MKTTLLLVLAIGFISLTGCAHNNTGTASLINTYWKLVEIKGAAVAVSDNQREPHIVLNTERRVAGSDGCNRMMGGYQVSGDKLQFTQMAGTRMACMQGAEQAQLIGATLPQVASYGIAGDQLELRDAGGVVIARFKAVALP